MSDINIKDDDGKRIDKKHIKIKAFLMAFILFGVTVVVVGKMSEKTIMGYEDIGTISSEARYKSTDVLENTLDDNSLLMFGSSEFQHGSEMIFHPANTFRNTDLKPVFVGKFGYQSLTHAITLASMAEGIPNKKIVLVVSPSWFVEEGVSSNAFASYFPEEAYIKMLQNEKLSDETKAYMKERTHTLLNVDKTTDNRIYGFEKYMKDENIFSELYGNVECKLYSAFLKQKQNVTLASNIREKINAKTEKAIKRRASEEEMEQVNKKNNGEPDFEYLNRQAEAEIEKIENSSEKNEFNMTPKGYDRIKKRKKNSRDIFKNQKNLYTDSIEEEDLRCFLKVCTELDIEPLLVVLPVNGLWYEYMGSSKESRQQFYQNIRDISSEFDAELVDLSEYEYEPYFLEDNVHLFGKGWNKFNECVYKFYKKTE